MPFSGTRFDLGPIPPSGMDLSETDDVTLFSGSIYELLNVLAPIGISYILGI